MDTEELRMFDETMAQVLAGTEGAKLPDTLRELGWFELWADEPRAAARSLFGQQGRLATASPMLSLLMGAELAGSDAAVILPSTAALDQGGWAVPDAAGTVRGLAQADALAATDTVLCAVLRDGEPVILSLPVAELDRSPVRGLDPELGLCRVVARAAAGSALASGALAGDGWASALATGRRLLADELVGVVGEQLRLALEHATARTQFGRPIASFQAVKHKLAEVYVALGVAEAGVDEAWRSPTPTACLLAKLHAAAALELANIHCQQVLGGIGFTWEHRFHWYARRGRVLAALLGSRAQLARELGRDIVETRTLPTLAEL